MSYKPKTKRRKGVRTFDATEWQRQFRKTGRGRRHTRAMNIRKYGITPEQYDEMFRMQGGVCASCAMPETCRNQYGVCRLAVDHCHDTGKVRGLLCMKCNRCLGLLKDEPAAILKLYRYLRRHKP